jgi:DGQHR domain-containing protein
MNPSPRLIRRTEEEADQTEKPTEWTFPCIRISQGDGREVYCFGVDGKIVNQFACVSRIGRSDNGELIGYQRPEVIKHIHAIRSYINSKGSFIPNAVVISFMKGIRFNKFDDENPDIGQLHIKISADGTKPGFIVDGQQRLAAVRDCERLSYPMFATAFVAKHEDEQRSQFVLVNNSKPLPKGLIYELLPSIHEQLPKTLSAKRVPAAITIALNRTQPFVDLIRMPTNSIGIIADTSIQRMVANSLANGLLRQTQNLQGADIKEAVNLLHSYWSIVADVFSDAWGQPPVSSRLMHGVGIVAMGNLMDYLSVKKPRGGWKKILDSIRPACSWTKGSWKLSYGSVAWNALENTPRQTAELSRFITRTADRFL